MYVHVNDCKSLRWRHNGRDGVSNHQPHDCLLNRLFRRRSKKTSKLRVTGLCAGNSPVTGEFPALRASNAGNVSIWWRHHVSPRFRYIWWYTVHEIFTYMCTCTRRTDSYLLIQYSQPDCFGVTGCLWGCQPLGKVSDYYTVSHRDNLSMSRVQNVRYLFIHLIKFV